MLYKVLWWFGITLFIAAAVLFYGSLSRIIIQYIKSKFKN